MFYFSAGEDGNWQEALDFLRKAMQTEDIYIKQSTMTIFVSTLLEHLPSDQIAELEQWVESLEESDSKQSDCADSFDRRDA